MSWQRTYVAYQRPSLLVRVQSGLAQQLHQSPLQTSSLQAPCPDTVARGPHNTYPVHQTNAQESRAAATLPPPTTTLRPSSAMGSGLAMIHWAWKELPSHHPLCPPPCALTLSASSVLLMPTNAKPRLWPLKGLRTTRASLTRPNSLNLRSSS